MGLTRPTLSNLGTSNTQFDDSMLLFNSTKDVRRINGDRPDQGIIFQRPNSPAVNNVAMIWHEATQSFKFITTTNADSVDGIITSITGNVAVSTGNLTVNGNLTLSTTPTTAFDVANKSYVDSRVSGKVLQVLQSVKTNTFSTVSTSFVSIPDLLVTITPSNANNKILILAQVFVGGDWWITGGTPLILVRNTTSIIQSSGGTIWSSTSGSNQYGPDAGTTAKHSATVPITYLDSPNTASEVSYRIQTRSTSATSPNTVNTSYDGSSTGISSILVMEIAA